MTWNRTKTAAKKILSCTGQEQFEPLSRAVFFLFILPSFSSLHSGISWDIDHCLEGQPHSLTFPEKAQGNRKKTSEKREEKNLFKLFGIFIFILNGHLFGVTQTITALLLSCPFFYFSFFQDLLPSVKFSIVEVPLPPPAFVNPEGWCKRYRARERSLDEC